MKKFLPILALLTVSCGAQSRLAKAIHTTQTEAYTEINQSIRDAQDELIRLMAEAGEDITEHVRLLPLDKKEFIEELIEDLLNGDKTIEDIKKLLTPVRDHNIQLPIPIYSAYP